jgi:hypothetical protein
MLYGGILWYAFPKVDDTISWEGIWRIDYWCCTFFSYKTPEYKKPTKYDWEKPDFNSEEDKFMQRLMKTEISSI